MIGFSANRKSKLASLIRFFTRSKWSHCFVLGPSIQGYATVIEASELVAVVPFIRNYKTNADEGYEVWDCIAATTSDKERAFARVFFELSGKQYGFFQLLWFVYDWAALTLRGKRSKKNPFPSGVICSEMNWYYLNFLGGEYRQLVWHLDPDTTHCGDLYSLIVNRPDLFKLTEMKELGNDQP